MVRWGVGALVLLGALGIGTVLVVDRADAPGMSTSEDLAPFERDEPGLVSWTAVVEVASGEAYQGLWRMNDSDFRYVDDPTVSITGKGAIGIAWADQARKDIFFRLYGRDGDERSGEPVNVSRSPGTFSWLPRLVVAQGEQGDADQVYVLWQDIVFSGGSHGGEIFFARSTDGGRTFSEPMNLSNTPAGAGKGRLDSRRWHNGSLDLGVGPDGAVHAAWTEYEGTLWYRRSRDGGESFSEPLAVAGGNGAGAAPARGPALAVDAGNTVYLVWTVGEDPAADIRLARSDDGGASFDAPRIVLESPGHADAPKIAVAGGGTVHLVWAESSEGPFRRYQIRYARSEDGGRAFEPSRDLSSPHPDGFESAGFPDLALDEEGGPYVLWHLFPDRTERPRGLGFAGSGDGGGTFESPSIVPGTAEPELGITGSLQGLLTRKLAVSEAGRVAVVNSSFQPGEVSRVRLIRGRLTER